MDDTHPEDRPGDDAGDFTSPDDVTPGQPGAPMGEEAWLESQRHLNERGHRHGDTPAGGRARGSGPFPARTPRGHRPDGAGLDPKMDRPRRRFSKLDLEMDPLLRLEDNRKSVRNAIIFAIMIPVVTLFTGLVIALISRSQGGPICDSGYSNWICTRTYEILFPVLPGIVSFGGLLVACGITWRQWAQDRYWQPWLGIIWILIPFTLLWATGVGAMAIVGHHTFPQP